MGLAHIAAVFVLGSLMTVAVAWITGLFDE